MEERLGGGAVVPGGGPAAPCPPEDVCWWVARADGPPCAMAAMDIPPAPAPAPPIPDVARDMMFVAVCCYLMLQCVASSSIQSQKMFCLNKTRMMWYSICLFQAEGCQAVFLQESYR